MMYDEKKEKWKTKSLVDVRGKYEEWHYNIFEKDIGRERGKKG